MRRHEGDLFLPGYYVFPGGALDEQDYGFEVHEDDRSGELKSFGDSPGSYYAHIMCGIRETFEEAGILFALDEKGNYPCINTAESTAKYSTYRKQVYENRISFMDMLKKENLFPAALNFFYMDRWITPSVFPIRYDARFFAAIYPACQEISHDNNELIEYRWYSPPDALKHYREGGIRLVMPTVSTLEFLSRFYSSEDVISFFRSR